MSSCKQLIIIFFRRVTAYLVVNKITSVDQAVKAIIPDTAFFENTATIQFLTIINDVNFRDSVYNTYGIKRARFKPHRKLCLHLLHDRYIDVTYCNVLLLHNYHLVMYLNRAVRLLRERERKIENLSQLTPSIPCPPQKCFCDDITSPLKIKCLYLHIQCLKIFSLISTKFGFSRQTLIKVPNTKFQRNLNNGSQFEACGSLDGQTGRNNQTLFWHTRKNPKSKKENCPYLQLSITAPLI